MDVDIQQQDMISLYYVECNNIIILRFLRQLHPHHIFYPHYHE